MPARCLPYLAYIAYDPTTYRQFGIFVLERLTPAAEANPEFPDIYAVLALAKDIC